MAILGYGMQFWITHTLLHIMGFVRFVYLSSVSNSLQITCIPPFFWFDGRIYHGSLALDSAVVWKISKRHFFQDIKNSFHGVTWMGLKTHQNFFQNFFSTNMVARGVQSFCILEGATDPLIEQWLKFLCQFTPNIWWTNAENFKSISWAVSDLWSFNWKILAIVRLLPYKIGQFVRE